MFVSEHLKGLFIKYQWRGYTKEFTCETEQNKKVISFSCCKVAKSIIYKNLLY